MNRQEYYAIRQYDWYENVPKDDHIEDQNFWCQEQIHIYEDVYLHLQKPIRPMQPYRFSDIQAKPTFAQAAEVIKQMGLVPIIET